MKFFNILLWRIDNLNFMRGHNQVYPGFSISIIQAEFFYSFSSIGTMSPQIHVLYPPNIVKTRIAYDQDLNPNWQETFNFENRAQDIELVAIHCPVLLNDVEIGRGFVKACRGFCEVEMFNGGRSVGKVKIWIGDEGLISGGLWAGNDLKYLEIDKEYGSEEQQDFKFIVEDIENKIAELKMKCSLLIKKRNSICRKSMNMEKEIVSLKTQFSEICRIKFRLNRDWARIMKEKSKIENELLKIGMNCGTGFKKYSETQGMLSENL